MIELFTIDANDMLIEAQLGGGVYHIGLSWNEEAQQWAMSIRDLNLSILVSGISVVPNWPLLSNFRRQELPPGEIIAWTPNYTPITRKTFVDRKAFLFYVDQNDAAI